MFFYSLFVFSVEDIGDATSKSSLLFHFMIEDKNDEVPLIDGCQGGAIDTNGEVSEGQGTRTAISGLSVCFDDADEMDHNLRYEIIGIDITVSMQLT